ncbi:MAG: YceK/YidQ family lipoprotein [Proteobacteria bacterium]|nr:YceK/YidQ family lipoprotein [Verrucomicrobiota bacterium]NBU07922.1 YceK/YidQ family lipoprotein [Pseudomonadota bacterium]
MKRRVFSFQFSVFRGEHSDTAGVGIGLFVGACLLSLTGCAAIGMRTNGSAPEPYAGVKGNAHYLANPQLADKPSLQFMNILDLPFSAALDTVLLPFDLSRNKRTTEATDSSPTKTTP